VTNGRGGAHDRWQPDGLGLRGIEQRREEHRRGRHRKGRERRRGDRRRASMRTLLLTAAALSAPHAAKVRASQHHPWGGRSTTTASAQGPLPKVSVNIDSYAPVEPRHAYDAVIAEAAEKYNLDPRMIKAVMETESAFDAMAVSPVGALGLMQLMPEVAAELGAVDPLDPRQNIMAGARYLRQLLDAHRGNVKLALASYNAGPGNVAKYRAIPPFKETRDYVKKVTALLAASDD
jgi:soluble lytic murein transglycosylase-like protein